MIVADESRNKELVRTGWVRVTNYDGDRREGYQGKRGVYQSTVGGMNKFKQGVIQTVNDTWQGVDALNGTSLSGETAGVYLGSRVQRISQQAYTNPGKNDGLKPDTYLQPIFNELNEVVSYERPISPALLKGLDKDTHLGRMLGVWVGRILEEEAADKANDSVVKVTKEIWDNLKGKQAGDFINVADPKNKDPVVRDAWKTFGWQVKQEAEAVFGAPDTFWVRKEMVNDLTGYRSPGIRDAWTGISRWKPEVRTTVVNASTMILGTNAYKWMTKTEAFVQDAVSLAKTTIIVRGVKVIVDNLTSNVVQLSMAGMTMPEIAKGMRAKFIEITQYVKNRELISKLEIKYKVAQTENDEPAAKRYQAQIAALESTNKSMSINALIEAGEFSTISESLTEADVAIRDNEFGEWLETAVDKLPSGIAPDCA